MHENQPIYRKSPSGLSKAKTSTVNEVGIYHVKDLSGSSRTLFAGTLNHRGKTLYFKREIAGSDEPLKFVDIEIEHILRDYSRFFSNRTDGKAFLINQFRAKHFFETGGRHLDLDEKFQNALENTLNARMNKARKLDTALKIKTTSSEYNRKVERIA